jgi:hypothetical protein
VPISICFKIKSHIKKNILLIWFLSFIGSAFFQYSAASTVLINPGDFLVSLDLAMQRSHNRGNALKFYPKKTTWDKYPDISFALAYYRHAALCYG